MNTTAPVHPEFDFLVPSTKPLLRPDEAAQYLGRSVRHIYALIEEGRLEAHAPADREVQRYVITRRSVLAALAETAQYDPAYIAERLLAVLPHLDRSGLDRVIQTATRLRAATTR